MPPPYDEGRIIFILPLGNGKQIGQNNKGCAVAPTGAGRTALLHSQRRPLGFPPGGRFCCGAHNRLGGWGFHRQSPVFHLNKARPGDVSKQAALGARQP